MNHLNIRPSVGKYLVFIATYFSKFWILHRMLALRVSLPWSRDQIFVLLMGAGGNFGTPIISEMQGELLKLLDFIQDFIYCRFKVCGGLWSAQTFLDVYWWVYHCTARSPFSPMVDFWPQPNSSLQSLATTRFLSKNIFTFWNTKVKVILMEVNAAEPFPRKITWHGATI